MKALSNCSENGGGVIVVNNVPKDGLGLCSVPKAFPRVTRGYHVCSRCKRRSMQPCLLLTQSCVDAGGLSQGPTLRAWGAPRFLGARGRSELLDTGSFVSCGDQRSASFCSFLQFLAVLPLHAERSASGERAPQDAWRELHSLREAFELARSTALACRSYRKCFLQEARLLTRGHGVTRATLSSGSQQLGLHILASRPAHTQTAPAPNMLPENWHSDPLPGCLVNTHFK